MKVHKLPQLFSALILAAILGFCSCAVENRAENWQLNQLASVGGYNTTVVGAPRLLQAEDGEKVLEFNGQGDGLLLQANPIAGAEAFSIEVVFKPYAGYPENREQRFLHIQDPANANRRILMELRLNNRGQWYPDFFMRTDSAALTLIDSTKTYPVGEWARMRLEYKDGELKGYVNGVEELSGNIDYMPISPAAQTAIGMRMNKVSWFKGAIKSVEIRPEAGVAER